LIKQNDPQVLQISDVIASVLLCFKRATLCRDQLEYTIQHIYYHRDGVCFCKVATKYL